MDLFARVKANRDLNRQARYVAAEAKHWAELMESRHHNAHERLMIARQLLMLLESQQVPEPVRQAMEAR